MGKVLIRENVYKKFMHFVDKASGEVSGLGAVELIDGVPVVTDVWLVEQENTGTSTDLDAKAVAKLMYEHRDKDLRWWVHSHANMGVFWSGTDQTTFKELGGNGWVCGTVFNKKREMLSAIFSTATRKTAISGFKEEEYTIFADKCETVIIDSTPKDVLDAWDKEYEDCCKSKTFRSSYWERNHEMGFEYGNNVTQIDWEERRKLPYHKMWLSDKCCSNWDTFIEKHKDTIEKLVANTKLDDPPKPSDTKEDNVGKVVAKMIEDERKEAEDYAEIKAEITGLWVDHISQDCAKGIIENLYGSQWTFLVPITYSRLDYDKKTGAKNA